MSRKMRKKKKRKIGTNWATKLFWVILGGFIGAGISLLFSVYINPIVLQKTAPEPELNIKVFQSHAPYANGTDVHGITWNTRYAEYIVMIQQNMSKAKSTPIEDIYIVFDFDTAILGFREEDIVGVTNPSIQLCEATIVGNGEVITDIIKSLQVIVDLETLKPGGLCVFSVIIDPDYEGSLVRTHIIPPRSYSGSYYYDARGIIVRKNVSGNIPAPRKD